MIKSSSRHLIKTKHSTYILLSCLLIPKNFLVTAGENFSLPFKSKINLYSLRGGASSSTLTANASALLPDIKDISSKTMKELTSDSPIRIIFSDVDGTLAHYPEDLQDDDTNLDYVKFPVSSTGMRGVISKSTLELCQKLKETQTLSTNGDPDNIKLVLVSGMRTTTLMKRLPFLPLADAYCTENGGRIFYPHPIPFEEIESESYEKKGGEFSPPLSDDQVIYRLQEDTEWRENMSRIEAAGRDGYHKTSPALTIPVESRKGVLWEFAADLMRDGWVIDHRGYATAFRIHLHKQVVPKLDEARLRQAAPPGLTITSNLASFDVYPSCSGKRNVCEYLVGKLIKGKISEDAICFCDDDNDIEMALACKYAFLPSLTSESIKETVSKHASKLFVATTFDSKAELGTTAATETILKAALEMCGSGVIQIK